MRFASTWPAAAALRANHMEAIGRVHADRVELVAVCDTDPAALAAARAHRAAPAGFTSRWPRCWRARAGQAAPIAWCWPPQRPAPAQGHRWPRAGRT